MKTGVIALFVVVVLALGGGLYWQNTALEAKKAEIAKMQEGQQELEQLRAEVAELRPLKGRSNEIERLRKDAAEVFKLRNDIRQVTSSQQAQVKQMQAGDAVLQQQISRLESENAQLRQQLGQAPAAPAAPAAGAPGAVASQVVSPEQMRNQCIANLRQIDGAKQQWALENKKTALDMPPWDELKKYLPQIPACPSGGHYQIHNVSQPPVCNLPGHVVQR